MSDTGRYQQCKTGADANSSSDCARVAVENSLNDYWARDPARAVGHAVHPEKGVETFTGSVGTGCGQATADVGPFYCPNDQHDLPRHDLLPGRAAGPAHGPSGDFVEPYVLAHEYGHHIQNLLGTMGKVKTQQGPKSDSVRLELQADCYAGMWTKNATGTGDGSTAAADPVARATGTSSEAIDAAKAVGDDRIQQETRRPGQPRAVDARLGGLAGEVVPDRLHHRRPQGLRHVRDQRPLSVAQPDISSSIWGNWRCRARRCGATAGWRYLPASAPSPPATRASAHSARLRAVSTAVTRAPWRDLLAGGQAVGQAEEVGVEQRLELLARRERVVAQVGADRARAPACPSRWRRASSPVAARAGWPAPGRRAGRPAAARRAGRAAARGGATGGRRRRRPCVRARVGQPPRRSTRAIRSRSWSRASHRAGRRSAPANRPSAAGDEEPAVRGVLDPVGWTSVMPSSSSSTDAGAAARRPGVARTTPDTATSAHAPPVGEVPGVAQLGAGRASDGAASRLTPTGTAAERGAPDADRGRCRRSAGT